MALIQIINEYNTLIAYRKKLQKYFGPEVRVLIGGSYALKFQLDEFKDRYVHDYDFIVVGTEKVLSEKRKDLDELVSLGILKKDNNYLDNFTYKLPFLNGRPCDLILEYSKTTPLDIQIFDSPEHILEIKKKWVKQRVRQGVTPRNKDLLDIDILEEVADLPF